MTNFSEYGYMYIIAILYIIMVVNLILSDFVFKKDHYYYIRWSKKKKKNERG